MNPGMASTLESTGKTIKRDATALTQDCVVCICGGYGFPLGNASAARIIVVGKALQRAGLEFHLLHCGPSPVPINNRRSGVYEGISFEYTTTVKRPQNALARLLVYARGLVGLTTRLVRLKLSGRRTVIYLYVGQGLLNLFAGTLCRLLGFPVVQELCEWMPGEPTCSAFNHWLYKKAIFKLATGALVISRAIEERVRERRTTANQRLLIHRLPSIVDASRFAKSTAPGQHTGLPQFVYCGTWLKDVFFVIRAFNFVKEEGYPCQLKIVGAWAEHSGTAILKDARSRGLSPEDIVFTGCVDERTLEASYRNATALLAPLWDDDRSRTRLPNKLGEYLASGRPVVAGRVGDLTEFLTDDVNACLAEPGNERDFADKMIAMLQDPRRARQIGAAGQQACIDYLDYRAHVNTLAKFFIACLDSRRR